VALQDQTVFDSRLRDETLTVLERLRDALGNEIGRLSVPRTFDLPSISPHLLEGVWVTQTSKGECDLFAQSEDLPGANYGGHAVTPREAAVRAVALWLRRWCFLRQQEQEDPSV
jgi:hypothetical protein